MLQIDTHFDLGDLTLDGYVGEETQENVDSLKDLLNLPASESTFLITYELSNLRWLVVLEEGFFYTSLNGYSVSYVHDSMLKSIRKHPESVNVVEFTGG